MVKITTTIIIMIIIKKRGPTKRVEIKRSKKKKEENKKNKRKTRPAAGKRNQRQPLGWRRSACRPLISISRGSLHEYLMRQHHYHGDGDQGMKGKWRKTERKQKTNIENKKKRIRTFSLWTNKKMENNFRASIDFTAVADLFFFFAEKLPIVQLCDCSLQTSLITDWYWFS